MKKILISLFLIAASMGITQLSAYCVYNWSKDKSITIKILAVKNGETRGIKASHDLPPSGGKRCWNWKEIDKNNREKQWAWKAYIQSSGIQLGGGILPIGGEKLGEGYFPIGGTIHFEGEVGGTVFEGFNIYYDGKPWEYWKSPWNWPPGERPWKTY